MIVADASTLFDVLRRRPAAAAIEARLLGSGLAVHVPHLLDAEVAQSSAGMQRAGTSVLEVM